VWADEGEDPAVNAFRDLVRQWLSEGRIAGPGLVTSPEPPP
jgi:hypothetical protein